MIDLNPNHLQTVKRILAEHLPGREVRAFGSRATWTAWDYSDLDLAVVSPEPLDWKVRSSVREAFEESDLPIRVDVVDWDSLSDGFRQTIDGDCVVLQEAVTSNNWRETTLGDVVELKRGYDLPKRNRISGTVPLVSSSGISDHHAEAKVKGPGVVTGRYGTIGEVFFIDEDFWPLNTTLYVRDFKGNDPRFIGYFLRTLDFFAYSDKAAVPGVNRNHLHTAPVRIPPLDEQRRIARILGALDDKIELNRRTCQTLEAMAQALFNSWFVDFDPVRAKANGQPTNLPPEIDALFPDSLQDSELGEIPDGWEVGTLGGVIEVNPHRVIKRGQLAKHVAMAALPTSGGQVNAWTSRPFASGSRFTRGDTLLARITPSLEYGKTAFVDFLDEGETGWGSTEFIVLRPKDPWPPEFGYLLAREPRFRDHAIVNMTGTSGRQRVPPEAVSTYALAIAPASVARAFGELVRPWFDLATTAADHIRVAAAIRDALLLSLIGP